MKKIIYASLFLFLSSCGVDTNKYNNLVATSDSLKRVSDSLLSKVSIQENEILRLKELVDQYSYPADQRFHMIKKYIESKDFNAAKKEIKELQRIFPNSKEASDSKNQLIIIDKEEKKKIMEEERLKALGFKALKQKTKFKVDYNTINFSNISIGSQFTFDSYDDRYFYREADRGNRYVTARMTVTSSIKSPNLPQAAVYTISGDKMIYDERFDLRYARWDDYGSYLGNEADYNNDFSKTGTIPFKIGAEISLEKAKSPFAIVIKNENVLIENYNRFDNPPKSWSGFAEFPNILKIEDFEKDYTLVKIFNLK